MACFRLLHDDDDDDYVQSSYYIVANTISRLHCLRCKGACALFVVLLTCQQTCLLFIIGRLGNVGTLQAVRAVSTEIIEAGPRL